MKKIFGAVVLALSLVLLACGPLYAVPANPKMQQFSQPSGQKFMARQLGDERSNWTITQSGDVVTRGTNGIWYYSQVTNKRVLPTTRRIGIDTRPTNALKGTDLVTKLRTGAITPTPTTVPATVLPMYSKYTLRPINISELLPVDTQKILVLLVGFSNMQIKNSDAVWNSAFFGTGTDSVNSYYQEVSGGKLAFAPAEETYGTANDGIVKVNLSYNHPNTASYVNELNQKLTRDALLVANSYVNFADYDTDNDGFISAKELHIVVIAAGYERSYSAMYPSVWGHSWALWDAAHTKYKTILDGKGIGAKDHNGGYTQEAEIQGDHRATIGIVCHELGHDLGLPDLYDYGYDSAGVGDFSLMAFGSWSYDTGAPGSSPTHLDAWSKIKLGFFSPTDAFANVSGQSVQKAVYSVGSGKYNIVKISTSNPKEYFLVENRQFEGYDKGLTPFLTKGGILILHIDESVTTNNDNQYRKLVDVEESNQGTLGYSQLDQMKYVRFGTHPKLNACYVVGNPTKFDGSTNPNSKFYSGAATNVTVTTTNYASSVMKINIFR